MTRHPVFWIAMTVVSIVATIAAYIYFPKAFPLVSLEITMDREAALERAGQIAADQRLGPAGYRQAASFALDEDVQTFVELEGGGKDAFARLMRDRLYSPYTWRVRHFKERETNETQIRFEPDGTPYGFREQLSEDTPGTTVSAADARRIAETTAAAAWKADFTRYQLVEQSQERKPKGRVDHRLVYERQDEKLGEGRYRLRLVVSGDRLTEFTYFIKIPEAFQRRYEQMRSANNAIGIASTVAMIVLYGVGGIVIGLFVLLRHRWVVWKQAVIWGFAVALLQGLEFLNQWPLLWMGYDTALSTGAYVAQQVATVLMAVLGLGVVMALSFMAAESLTRRAFPAHPQFWRVWSRDAAPTPSILGRTVAGLLLVGIFFAYDVFLYFFALRKLGWWTPSEALFHPDVLATYFPWFSSLAPSLQAGFWEECLFRAVPIAGAALIGDRIGQRRLMIVLAFVVQSLVFGAGHAPYPTQPAYARVAELILPSILFGYIYLAYGLLPAIVLHFVFDVVWFALPLFVSTAPGVWIDKTLVVAVALVPLWIVVGARARRGAWLPFPAALRNGAWTPPAPAAAPAVIEEPRPTALPTLTRRVLPIAGVVSLVLWIAAAQFRAEIPGIPINRRNAIEAARRGIGEAGGRLTDAWRLLARADDGRSSAHRFVLDTSGREVYTRLLGSYLDVPQWQVRGVTFEGDVAERAEEWLVDVEGSGSLRMVHHTLPEARPGAALSEAQAREAAYAFIQQRYGLTRDKVREVSLEPSTLKARTDWEAIFADLDTRGLTQGELRIRVNIAGDAVTGAERFVYVPEEWERRNRNERTIAFVASLVGGLALVALLIGEAVVAVVSWSRRVFAVRLFLALLALQIVLRTINAINQWPVVEAAFSTAQPWRLQRGVAVVALGIGVTIPSAVLALIAGAAPTGVRRAQSSARARLTMAAALGAIAAALLALGGRVAGSGGPVWPVVSGADTLVPAVAAALSVVSSYLLWTIGVLVVVMAADQITHGWTRWRVPVAIGILLVGISIGALGSQGGPLSWTIAGLVIGALTVFAYVAVFRYEAAVLPLATAVLLLTSAIRTAVLGSFPGAAAGAMAGALVVLAVGWWWSHAIASAQAAETPPG